MNFFVVAVTMPRIQMTELLSLKNENENTKVSLFFSWNDWSQIPKKTLFWMSAYVA